MSHHFPSSAIPLEILGEYRGLVFVDKPAGLQTEPDARSSTDTLVFRVAQQLGRAVTTVHALSRLDTAVSGVVTLGLEADARRLVQSWREQGRFSRRYLALAAGDVSALPARGVWSEAIGRGAGSLRSVNGRHAEGARTDYAVIDSSPSPARTSPERVHLLALAPLTGRTHQLRVHCAAHGLPLLGDRAYGGASRVVAASGAVRALERIALHAAWVELPLSPPRRIEASTPRFLLELWAAFGGLESALASARGAALGAAHC